MYEYEIRFELDSSKVQLTATLNQACHETERLQVYSILQRPVQKNHAHIEDGPDEQELLRPPSWSHGPAAQAGDPARLCHRRPGRQFVSSAQIFDALVKITERQWRRHSRRI